MIGGLVLQIDMRAGMETTKTILNLQRSLRIFLIKPSWLDAEDTDDDLWCH